MNISTSLLVGLSFFISSTSSAVLSEEILNCANAIGFSAFHGTHALPATGDSFLILNKKGAKLVKGKSSNNALTVEYTPPGDDQLFLKGFFYRDDGSMHTEYSGVVEEGWVEKLMSWPDSKVAAVNRRSTNISEKEALSTLGLAALREARKNSREREKKLEQLVSYMKIEGVARQIGSDSDESKNNSVNIERLERERSMLKENSAKLRECSNKVADDNLKKAAKLELASLDELSDQLDKLATEHDAFLKCIKSNPVSESKGTKKGSVVQ